MKAQLLVSILVAIALAAITVAAVTAKLGPGGGRDDDDDSGHGRNRGHGALVIPRAREDAAMTKIVSTALLAALVVAGCGGGGGLEKEALADKANAICEKFSKQGEALGSPDLADPKKAEDYFNKASDLANEQQDELEALKPAEAVKADYDALTKATGDATGLLTDLAAAAKDKDQKKGVELVQKLTPISAAVDEAATKIGADSCAG